MQDLLKYLNSYKSILIWGFGLEGHSTYNFLSKHLSNVRITIADANIPKDLPSNVEFVKSSVPLDALASHDLVIKSPGISLYNCKIKPNTFPITSQTELSLRFYKNQIIGITGTKGKSTTATLMHLMLLDADKKSVLVGNIGQPVFDVLSSIEIDTYLVYELSAHQLDNVHFSPHISILLNLYQEHLDYYETVEDYFEAKKQIFRHQNENDFFFDKEVMNNKIINSDWKIPLSVHLLTVQAMLCVADILNINEKSIRNAVESFNGLEHRLELVGEYNGISYYNDSISTAVESTLFALEKVPNIQTFIMGGDDRGIDYLPLANELKKSNIKLVITMFNSGKVLNKLLQNLGIELFHTDDFDEALKKSYKNVLFSPASASYGSFKNFIQRGEKFKEAVIRKNKS